MSPKLDGRGIEESKLQRKLGPTRPLAGVGELRCNVSTEWDRFPSHLHADQARAILMQADKRCDGVDRAIYPTAWLARVDEGWKR